MNRGDVVDVELPIGPHPGVVVTGDRAIPFLRNVSVVVVTSTIRELPTEVSLGRAHGLARDCVANCDNVFTVPKRAIGRHRGSLSREETEQLNRALRIALELD